MSFFEAPPWDFFWHETFTVGGCLQNILSTAVLIASFAIDANWISILRVLKCSWHQLRETFIHKHYNKRQCEAHIICCRAAKSRTESEKLFTEVFAIQSNLQIKKYHYLINDAIFEDCKKMEELLKTDTVSDFRAIKKPTETFLGSWTSKGTLPACISPVFGFPIHPLLSISHLSSILIWT